MVTRQATGFFPDMASLATNGLRAVRTRLELLTIELKEEKAWLTRFLVVAVAAIYFTTFGTLLAILAFSLAMPETTRPAVLGGFGALFLALGIGAVAYVIVNAKKRAPPFQDTIATLKRDEKSLGGAGE